MLPTRIQDLLPRIAPAVILALTLPLLAERIGTAQESQPSRAQQLARWLERFPAADTDGDGRLTEAEAAQYRRKLQAQRRRQRPAPSEADVKYGPHARNVLDLWQPEGADGPAPLLVYFHGGGFVAGDKSSFDPTPFLEDGMAVVSANYRFVDGRNTLSPAPMHDAARVIQFLRQHAQRWNLDPDRIGVSGGSAGAVIAMWLGYHDDLADPDSDDPVSRQSTRVTCIAPLNGPANLDPRWITQTMGGPPHVHGSFPKMFGVGAEELAQHPNLKLVLESSPIEHVSAGDAPSLLIYTGSLAGIPLPASASTGVLIHHAYFGKALKKRLDAAGVACDFHHSTDPRQNGYKLMRRWLNEHGLAAKPRENAREN